jgi:dephospho-CoA kinase
LEAIVHPLVRRRALEIEAGMPGEIVVHAVPLLFEGDFWKQCDRTVLVYAPLETRVARIIEREGWSHEEIARRVAAQIDPAQARERADFVIENVGDLPHLHAEVERVYSILRRSLTD